MVDDVESSSKTLVGMRKPSHRGRTWRRRKRARRNSNSPHILLDAQYIDLLKWAKHNGVVFRNLQPAIFKDTGRGMMSTRKITHSDEIISVPKRLLITQSTALQSSLGTLYERVLQGRNVKLSNKGLLYIYLIYLKYLGNKSFWHPYIITLPNTFNTPCFFENEELKFLTKSCYRRSIDQINEVKEAFKVIQEIFGKELKDFDVNFWKFLTYEHFRWAWCVVNTRSVFLNSEEKNCSGFYGDRCFGDNYALAPVLDLLNHSDTAEIHAGFYPNSQAYKICTVTQYQRQQQVFINYGPHDNTTLFIEYGFILPKNVHNTVKFELSQVYGLTDMTKITKKIDLIRKNGLEKDFSCSFDHSISWSLQTGLRILALNDDELDQWTKVFDGSPLSTDKEQLVYKWTILLTSTALNKLDTEGGELLTEQQLSMNTLLALELRKQEKQILERVLCQLEESTNFNKLCTK